MILSMISCIEQVKHPKTFFLILTVFLFGCSSKEIIKHDNTSYKNSYIYKDNITESQKQVKQLLEETKKRMEEKEEEDNRKSLDYMNITLACKKQKQYQKLVH